MNLTHQYALYSLSCMTKSNNSEYIKSANKTDRYLQTSLYVVFHQFKSGSSCCGRSMLFNDLIPPNLPWKLQSPK